MGIVYNVTRYRMEMDRVAAFIIDYNTTDLARRLSLQIAGDSPSSRYEVDVYHVDNGNLTPVELSEEQKAADVKLLRIQDNKGYGAGITTSAKLVNGSGDKYTSYWFLNSDLEIKPGCLDQLVRVLKEHKNVAAVGPTVFKGHSTKIWGARGVVSPMLGLTSMTPWPRGGVLPKWSYIPGCSLLVRKTAFDQVGGLPLQYKMYFEETQFCIELQKSGWDLWVEPNAEVFHSVKSMEKEIPARHFAYFFARNHLYFWKQNFGIPWGVQLPRTVYAVAKELVLPLRRSKTIKDPIDRLKYIGAGLVDGVRFLDNKKPLFERKLFKETLKD